MDQPNKTELDRRKRARLQLIEPALLTDDESSSSNADDLSTAPSTTSIPRAFQCPITREVMLDPVLDAEGNTYERSALLTWLSDHHTSPVSRQPLSARTVTPNNALRETIHEFMGKAWVQQREEELRKQQPDVGQEGPTKLRAKIDSFLKNTSHNLGGLELQLNEEGCCAFQYDGITIVLDVPENAGILCLYTQRLVPFYPPQLKHELYKRAMELNFLQGDTRGGCLSIRRHVTASSNRNKKGEIMFSYTDRVSEISAHDFSNVLLNFVETAVALRDKLVFGYEPSMMEDGGVGAEEFWAEGEDEEEEEVDYMDVLDKTTISRNNDAVEQEPTTSQPTE